MLQSIFYIKSDKSQIYNLINTIWQVRGVVSLLSIILISLIINKLDSRMYGQTVKDVLLIRKFYNFNYWDKVIIALILVIGIYIMYQKES